MESDTAVKRHPVGYGAAVIYGSVRLVADKHLVGLLELDIIIAFRRHAALGHTAGNTGTAKDNIAVLDHIDRLIGQVHLGIGAAVIFPLVMDNSPVLPDCLDQIRIYRLLRHFSIGCSGAFRAFSFCLCFRLHGSRRIDHSCG